MIFSSFRKKTEQFQKGFTLTELMIVMVIIGVLAAIIFSSTQSAQASARDSKRYGEINQIQKALQRYYLATGSYPSSLDLISIEEDAAFAATMKDYLAMVPKDPLYKPGGEYTYQYISTTTDSYVLLAKTESKEGYVYADQMSGIGPSQVGSSDVSGLVGESGEGCSTSYYSPNGGWVKVADTVVRDIGGAYNSTISKDIYCDNDNCIFWTDNASAPGEVCIPTDPDVYANLLWSKTDIIGTKAYGGINVYLSGDQIGGMHPAGTVVGQNQLAIGGQNWLNRDYTSGSYPAMNACKAKGDGWRLPTILELDGIRDETTGAPPYTRLPNIVVPDQWSSYWSSTERSDYHGNAMNFYNRLVYSWGKDSGWYVRCVRDE